MFGKRLIRWCLSLILMPGFSYAGQEAKVFPVQAFFYDSAQDSKLDPIFRQYVTDSVRSNLAFIIHKNLSAVFGARVGKLNAQTDGYTFAVSAHVTRANSFVVDKGNGNSDVVATITGGLYFTNVATGEILTTISRTAISRSVVPSASNLERERQKLFEQALVTVLRDLIEAAPRQFKPILIQTQLSDRKGNFLVFDAGFKKGIEVGDKIEDAAGNLVEIFYSGESYAIGKMVIPGDVALGSTFQKFLAHPASGKDRPRVTVLVESLPAGYGKDYVARLFAELLGDTSPLSIVQINTAFSQLLQTIRVQPDAEISLMNAPGRRPPNLIVRLRVPQVLNYEVGTNLDFERFRLYEARAFADIIDNTGKIIFSAIGVDVIRDKVVRGIAPSPVERIEVNIKNALTDLAKNLSKIGDIRKERDEILASSASSSTIGGQGRVYGKNEQGLILRKEKAKFGDESREILVPLIEAKFNGSPGQSPALLDHGLRVEDSDRGVSVGDLFEVNRLGTSPRSAASFAVCGPVEVLGNVKTPGFIETTVALLSQKMPGLFYAPEAIILTNDVIGPASGFSGKFPWDLPSLGYCVQPVERVTVGDPQCGEQCERPIVSRYTMRVKKNEQILARIAFEQQFKSSGYYPKTTAADQLNKLLEVDVSDEARGLLEKVVDKIAFPAP